MACETKPLIEKRDGSGEKQYNKVPGICSQRWILAYVGFFGFVFLYALRVNLSVGIVCMVNDTGTDNSSRKVDGHPEFYWSKAEQFGILSSYFYGYILTQLPGGWLAGYFGGKYVVGVGMLIGSVTSLFLPIGARASIILVYTLRVMLGISEGVMYPAFSAMMGKWAPPLERSKLTGFVFSGIFIGNILTFATSGFLCEHGFDNGWPSLFYLPGAACLVWCGIWFLTAYNTPAQHPRISSAEREYIQRTIGEETETNVSTPWAAIFTSASTWAITIALVCNNWVGYSLLTSLPTFLKEVLDFDITENGLLSSVPYISQLVVAVAAGQVADLLRSRKVLSTIATRKSFQISAFVGSGACLVGTGFIGINDRAVAVVLLASATAFVGLSQAGYLVNAVDFAPRYAGVLFGIANTAGTVPGLVAPIVAGALTPHKSQEEWRNVFYLCAVFCVVGAVVFGVFAKGELEPWATEETEVLVKPPEETEDLLNSKVERVDDDHDWLGKNHVDC